jgi:hypothetical protein
MIDNAPGGIHKTRISRATYIWVNFEALLAELAIGEKLALLLRMIVRA